MSDNATGRRLAISDIHGCANTFRYLLHDKLKVTASDKLYILGDLINRGPDSKGVLKEVRKLRKSGVEIMLLRGNHEAVLLEAVNNGNTRHFLDFGGGTTLRSFGVKKAKKIPSKYLTMIEEAKYYHEEEKELFVHAGFNFSKDDLFEDREYMLWAKKMTLDKKKLGDRIIIHGHTPWSKSAIKAQFKLEKHPSVINIDCGCVYKRPGSRLCALNVDTLELTFVKNKE